MFIMVLVFVSVISLLSNSVAGILFAMKIGNLMLALVDPMVSVMQFLQMNVLFVIIAISLWLFNDLLLWRRAQ